MSVSPEHIDIQVTVVLYGFGKSWQVWPVNVQKGLGFCVFLFQPNLRKTHGFSHATQILLIRAS